MSTRSGADNPANIDSTERGADESRRRFLRAGGMGAAVGAGAFLAPGSGHARAAGETSVSRRVTEFGAVGDGKTDDTAAIQAAFAELGSDPDRVVAGIQGGHLQIPPGEYRLTSTVNVHRFAGIVEGTGVGHTPVYPAPRAAGRGTAFVWDGPAGEPMFRITDSAFLTIRDLRFSGNDHRPPSIGLNFHKEREHQSGTNGHLLVEDCTFGVWPWVRSGDRGLMGTAIAFTNAEGSGDNDQFRINRCLFRGPREPYRDPDYHTGGIRIEGSQSIWGSIHDCTFDHVTIGLDTVASTTLSNAQFNGCGTDISVGSTAAVTLLGWQSEHSHRLARLSPAGSLHVVGGMCMIRREHYTDGQPLIDAFPSGEGQSLSLRDLRFFRSGQAGADSSRPPIRFGPSETDRVSAGGSGFYIRIDNCVGLHPEQCQMVGEMYASVPRSRGLVEWHSRGSGGVSQFRNELWAGGPDGTRTTIDTGAWDPPRAGLHD